MLSAAGRSGAVVTYLLLGFLAFPFRCAAFDFAEFATLPVVPAARTVCVVLVAIDHASLHVSPNE